MSAMFWEDLLKLLWVLSDILECLEKIPIFDHIFQVGLVQPPPIYFFFQQRKWKTSVGHGLDWFWIPTLDTVQPAAQPAALFAVDRRWKKRHQPDVFVWLVGLS